MTVKVHIERLVVDPGVITRSEAPLFGEALARELTYLRDPPPEPRAPAADPIARLVRRTASAIHDRLPRRTGSSDGKVAS